MKYISNDMKKTSRVSVYDNNGQEISSDLFDDATRYVRRNGDKYYVVDDVDYPCDYALDMAHGTGDFDTPSQYQFWIEYSNGDLKTVNM